MGGLPRGRPTDPGLGNLSEALRDAARREINPDQAPKLRAHAVGTLAELRKIKGDRTGNGGPAGCIFSGWAAPMDGGQGIFVWDHVSTKADDGGAVLPNGTIQVANVPIGRWRRIL